MPGGEGPKNAGGVPALFYETEGMLKQIAFILPAQAEKINTVIEELRSMMANALSGGGSSPMTGQPGMGGISSPTEEMKSGY
jgi:hypothetical protein